MILERIFKVVEKRVRVPDKPADATAAGLSAQQPGISVSRA
jgi:hypothetical protein